MGGTFVTYDWTFAEGGSITSSKDSVPSVKYDKPGTYSASLFINKGTDTTSAEITCKVIVTGVPVKGCTCSSPDAINTLYYKSGAPATTSWKVSGCTGGETFNYTWGGTGISGSSTSASGSFTSAGSVAPTLTVTNEDGEKMSVTCPAVKVEAFPLSGSCTLYSASSSVMPRSTVKFSVPSRSWNQDLGQTLTMNVEGAYEATTASVNLYYNADGAFSFKAPDTPGQQTVKLTYKGMEFCSMSLTVKNGQLSGADRLGIVTPWAATAIKRAGASASLGTAVGSMTVDDHILHYALDLDGDGIIEGASVGGESVDVRATVIVWCAGKDGYMEPYSRGIKEDDVYSWGPGQTKQVK